MVDRDKRLYTNSSVFNATQPYVQMYMVHQCRGKGVIKPYNQDRKERVGFGGKLFVR